MIASYWVASVRIIIGLTFILSLSGKLRDVSSFEQTITRFKFFPSQFSRILVYLFMSGELAVVVSMLVGGPLLLWGLLVAALMFLAFSIGLSSVVLRKIQTSCNCFGPSEKMVTPYHIVRSVGLMLCAAGGCGTLATAQNGTASLGVLDWGLAGIVSVVFVALWIQLGDIVQLFR